MRRAVYTAEILIALRLGALGKWWAASAARRLRKYSASEAIEK